MGQRLQPAWLDLNAALDAELAGRGAQSSEILEALASLRGGLRDAVVKDDFRVQPGRDYAAILEGAIAPGQGQRFAGVVAALAEVRDQLPWDYHYAPRPGQADLAERIAFAELVGPDGPMMAAGVRVGLTLIAPRTFYPMHEHPAVELYWVISGHARWATRRDDRIAPPGEFVLHRSGEAHSMHTLEEPLLALWGWSGDIDTAARYTASCAPA